jgi:hypothetical protein
MHETINFMQAVQRKEYPEAKQVQSTDEIDLLQVTIKLIEIIKRRYSIAAFSIVAGLLCSYLFYYVQPPRYRSTLICQAVNMKKADAEQTIAMINLYLAEDKGKALEDRLNLESKTFESLQQLSLTDFQEDGGMNTLYISAIVESPDNFARVEKGVVEALKENIVANGNSNTLLTKYKNTITALNFEKKKIDSLFSFGKTLVTSSARQSSEYADLIKLKIEIQKEKIELEEKLKNAQVVHIFQHFPQYKSPSNKNLPTILFCGVSVSLLLSCFVIFILELRPLIKKDHEKFKIIT